MKIKERPKPTTVQECLDDMDKLLCELKLKNAKKKSRVLTKQLIQK